MKTAIRRGLLALIVLSPLPFGAVQPWAVLTLEAVAALLGALALAVVATEREALGGRARPFVLLGGLLLAIGALQLVPLPESWAHWLAPDAVSLRARVASAVPLATEAGPVSLCPPDTLDALLRLGAYALVACAAAVSMRDRDALRSLALAVAASGAFQALYGSAEYLSGRQQIFGYAKKFYLNEATGTFINRNHFAIYLAMTLPFALALTVDLARRRRYRGESWRARLYRLLRRRIALRLGAGLAAALVWVGVFLSYSRMGLAAAVLASIVFALAAGGRRRLVAIVAGVLVIPALVLMWQEVKAPGERFVTDAEELTSIGTRLPVWTAAAGLVPRHLVLGTGYGTFESAFVSVQHQEIGGRWDHAHNDWLEALIEGGLTAALIVAALAALALTRVLEDGRGPLAAALAASLTTIAVASLTDFSLRIPCVATLAACLVGCAVSLPVPDDPKPGVRAVAP